MMCNLSLASYPHLFPSLLHIYNIYGDRASRHHEEDDSRSKKGKSKGKGASPRHVVTTKDQEAALPSGKRKTPPSGSRTGEKKKKKKPILDVSGSENDDSDFEKTPTSKKQRIKKAKKDSRKSVGGVNNDVGEEVQDNQARTPSRYVRIS